MMRIPPGVLLLLVSGLLISPGQAKDSDKAKLEGDGNGLQTATFDTLSGTVTVNLPEEVAAGDTISGTVVAEPAGDTEKKREKNLGMLTGYVLEVEGQSGEVGDGRLTLTLPGAGPTAALVLREVRKGKPGREIGRVDLPLLDLPDAPAGFQLPTVGQTGRPLVVRGRFDGDLARTGLTVGDTAALPLAESPRVAIFRSPANIVGSAPVTLREQGQDVAWGEFRNVDVRLSAPRVDLRPGEATTLAAVVSGLEDLEEEIPLTLDVWPTAVVNVEGGHHHDLTIRPMDVDAAGTYRLSLAVTGRLVGRWTAKVTVETPEPASADRFVLVLEGDPVGYLRSVSGGTISTPETDSISFDVGLDMERPLYDWLRDSFASGPVRKSGEIVATDSRGAEIEVHEFNRAFIDSVTFPELDGSDKSPAYMTIKIDPERIRYKKGDGSQVGPVFQGNKKWLCSNFRFEIGSLPLERVSKVDSFTWKQGGDMKLTVSTAELFSWEGWHRAFVGPERAAGNALDGRLVLLGPDLDEELATIELHDATTASLAVGTEECIIELVNSRLSFSY